MIGYHRIGELLHLVVALLGSKLAGFNLEQVAAGSFAHEICRFRSEAEGRIDIGLLAERLRQRWPPSAEPCIRSDQRSGSHRGDLLAFLLAFASIIPDRTQSSAA